MELPKTIEKNKTKQIKYFFLKRKKHFSLEKKIKSFSSLGIARKNKFICYLKISRVPSAFVPQRDFDIFLGAFFAFCLFLLQKDFDIFASFFS